jgi:hypothetical protein
MGEAPQLNTTIQKTVELASRCAQAETSDNYGLLGDQVGDLESEAREALQSKMNFGSLLPKLKAGKPLTPDDLKTLELLIVGDAEYFLKYETEFDHWKSEVQQLIGDISKLQSGLPIRGSTACCICARFAKRLAGFCPPSFITLIRRNGQPSFRKRRAGRLMRKAIECSPRSSSKCCCPTRCSGPGAGVLLCSFVSSPWVCPVWF